MPALYSSYKGVVGRGEGPNQPTLRDESSNDSCRSLNTTANEELSEPPSEFQSTTPSLARIQACACSDESSEDFTPASRTAEIPRRRSMTKPAIDRLRHKLFQGNKLAARD